MKKHRIVVSTTADGDIWETVHYISENLSNPVAAQKMLDLIEKQYDLLEQTPRMGTEYMASSGKVYRYVVIRNYMMFYTVEDTNVVIRRFLFAPSNIGVRLD